jgi:hypothetical protein
MEHCECLVLGANGVSYGSSTATDCCSTNEGTLPVCCTRVLQPVVAMKVVALRTDRVKVHGDGRHHEGNHGGRAFMFVQKGCAYTYISPGTPLVAHQHVPEALASRYVRPRVSRIAFGGQ